jgi:hypothetical protein
MVKPGVMCWSKTWAMAEMDMKRLNIWGRTYRLVEEQRIWKIRTNYEFRELCKYTDLDMVADIKKKRLE